MYVILFIVGLGFILVSFLLDVGTDGQGGPLAIFQPKLIAVFLLVTGGVGMMLSPRLYGLFGGMFVFTVSALCGLFIAGIIHRFILVPLFKAQNTSAHDKQATIGTWAKVISPIPRGGYGKIRYSVSGSVVTSPAKSEDGGEIRNGENVAIVYIEGGTYFVRREAYQQAN
ncbi:MAG: hypothetical protein FWC32_08635 [Firmicutes bacterium]|nr:hypothetical protein [Bacillota bacterium]